MNIGYLTLKFGINLFLAIILSLAISQFIISFIIAVLHGNKTEQVLTFENTYMFLCILVIALAAISFIMYKIEGVQCVTRFLEGVIKKYNKKWSLEDFEGAAYKLRIEKKEDQIQQQELRQKQKKQKLNDKGINDQILSNMQAKSRHSGMPFQENYQGLLHLNKMWKREEQQNQQKYNNGGYLRKRTLDTDNLSRYIGHSNSVYGTSSQTISSNNLKKPTNLKNQSKKKILQMFKSEQKHTIAQLNRAYNEQINKRFEDYHQYDIMEQQVDEDQIHKEAAQRVLQYKINIGHLLKKAVFNSQQNLQYIKQNLQKYFDVHVISQKQSAENSQRNNFNTKSTNRISHSINKINLEKFVQEYSQNQRQIQMLPLKSNKQSNTFKNNQINYIFDALFKVRKQYDNLLYLTLNFKKNQSRNRIHQIINTLADALIQDQNIIDNKVFQDKYSLHFQGNFQLQQFIKWFMVNKINSIIKRKYKKGLIYIEQDIEIDKKEQRFFNIIKYSNPYFLHYYLTYTDPNSKKKENIYTKVGPNNLFSLFWLYFQKFEQIHKEEIKKLSNYIPLDLQVFHSQGRNVFK